jgi:catechol 2,3-dioxygenase-like lactoylglutathione lyase family enzyme
MGIKASILLLTALLAAPGPQPSPALAGIAHVALRVADLQKSRGFYQTLGFEQAFEFADPGKAPVSYMKVNDRQFIELYQRADDSQPLGLMHVCYEANDIDALYDSYVKRGVSASGPKKARAGNLLFSLHDPENQTLEFTQYMPGSLHFEDRGKHLGEHRITEHILRATIPVGDLTAERQFYTSKLGFEDVKAVTVGEARLRIPGASGDEIELEIANKPRITFAVGSVERASRELGIGLSYAKGNFSIKDPDGAVITLTEDEHGKR